MIFFGGHTKNRSSFSLWKKICGQKAHKSFSGKFGVIQAKIFHTPKISLLLDLCAEYSTIWGIFVNDAKLMSPNFINIHFDQKSYFQ